MNNSSEVLGHEQKRIWEYAQSHPDSFFFGAGPRLDTLIRRIESLAEVSCPMVLNVGTGNGYFELEAKERGWKIWSADPDAKTIARMEALGIPGKVGPMESLPFPDRIFDFVVSSEVLEHLDDSQRARGVAEISRILKSDGYFIGTVPYQENLAHAFTVCPHCGGSFSRWGHQKSFSEESMAEELSAHFAKIRVTRTVFVPFRAQPLARKVKSAARWILAKAGAAIAQPSIYFVATQPKRPS
jgi:SAM-dependent methyltransferase